MQVIYLTDHRVETLTTAEGVFEIKLATDVDGAPMFSVTSIAAAVGYTRPTLLQKALPAVMLVQTTFPATPTRGGCARTLTMVDGLTLRAALKKTRKAHAEGAARVLQWLYTSYPEPTDPAPTYGVRLLTDLRPILASTLPVTGEIDALTLRSLLTAGYLPDHDDAVWLPFRVKDGALQLTLPSASAEEPDQPRPTFTLPSAAGD